MLRKTTTGKTLTGTGRWIGIRYNKNGSPFFMHYGHRFSLGDFLQFGGPWGPPITPTWEESDGLHQMAGIQADRWDAPLMVEINDCGERVRVWQEVLPA